MSAPAAERVADPHHDHGGRPLGLRTLAGLVLVLVALRVPFGHLLSAPAARAGTTIFLAVVVQALPFLALGVVLSAALAAFVPDGAVARALPRRSWLAVPVAGLAGAALPGCECASVPLAGRLVDRGVPPGAAVTFLLSAPAVNPVVLVATAVAFPGRPVMVLARAVASLTAAIVVGLVWSLRAPSSWTVPKRVRAPRETRWATAVDTAQHDLLHAGGLLVVGALAAALLQTAVPRDVLASVGGNAVAAPLVMAVLAVVLALCSEADAFVAAGLTQFSLSARLVFLVVGPAVDVKLVALHVGTFGWRFAARFAPLVFVTTALCAVVVGGILL